MNEIILENIDGNKIKANYSFTYFDYGFGKNYNSIDNDLPGDEICQ